MTENNPELIFSDLQAGRTFRPLEYSITERLVREFMETVGDKNPLYFDAPFAEKSSPGSPIAPPGLATIYARQSYLQDHTMPSGGVLAKQEFEFIKPIRFGDTLTVKAQVTEHYLDKKERKRVNFLIKAENQKGELVSTVRLFAIWPK